MTILSRRPAPAFDSGRARLREPLICTHFVPRAVKYAGQFGRLPVCVGRTLRIGRSFERLRLLTQKSRRDLILMLGVTLLYWLAAWLGDVFSDHGYLTPVWPAAAVGCVAGILYGPICLLGAAVFIAYDFVANGTTHGWLHDRWAFVEPVSMLASAAVVRWLAVRVGFTGKLDTVRAVLMMMAFGVLFAFVNGAGGTAGYCGLAGTRHCVAYGWPGYWIQSMVGDVFGCLICMPALLSWARWIDSRFHPAARRLPQASFSSERRRAPRVARPAIVRAPAQADSRLPRVDRKSVV